MQKIISFLVLMLSGTFFSLAAQGAITAPADVAEKITANYIGIKSYSVVINFDDQDLSLRIWQQSGFWRQEWVSDSSGREKVSAVAVGKEGSSILSYGVSQAAAPLTSIIFKKMAWWENRGLQPQQQSYHFFHGRPSLVMGMAGAEDPKPHLWIDNEDMVILRMVFSDMKKLHDLAWLEYRNVGNYKLPHKLVIDSEDFDMTCNVEWRDINSEYSRELFSPDILRQSFSNAKLDPPELIVDYYHALETVF
ncbi:MAG: hypothetical protein R6X11_10625 [Desulfonatronovibrio sp.]